MLAISLTYWCWQDPLEPTRMNSMIYLGVDKGLVLKKLSFHYLQLSPTKIEKSWLKIRFHCFLINILTQKLCTKLTENLSIIWCATLHHTWQLKNGVPKSVFNKNLLVFNFILFSKGKIANFSKLNNVGRFFDLLMLTGSPGPNMNSMINLGVAMVLSQKSCW